MANNTWDIIAQNFPPDAIPKLKQAFAKAMAKHDEDTDAVLNDTDFSVAMQGNIGCKLWAINNWSYDLEIKKLIEHYKTDAVAEILPSKAQIAQKLLAIADKAYNIRDKIFALQEYSKIMGFDKEETATQTGSNQSVILVTDNGSNLNWEEKLRKNQYELQANADKVLGLDDEVVKH